MKGAFPRNLAADKRRVYSLIVVVDSGDRASLESTIQQVSLPLESVLVDPMPKDLLPIAEARKMDLEMAVIMQVLIKDNANKLSKFVTIVLFRN